MTVSAVSSVIDVALWFMDRARREDAYLQPQKLQRLLYIAQGSFAALHHGRKLMPAVFVAGETGPQDANVLRVFEFGRPDILGTAEVRPEIARFLDEIWRRYGHHGSDYLNDQLKTHPAFASALKKGAGTEIPFQAIYKHFIRPDGKRVEKVRTADGRTLQKWQPAALTRGTTPRG